VSRPGYSRREHCRCCNAQSFDEIYSYGNIPIGDQYVPETEVVLTQELYPLTLYRCRTCSHVQLLDLIDPALLYGHFTYRTQLSPSLVSHFSQYCAEVIRQRLAGPGKRVLDIGSNDGTLLSFFKKQGCVVYGVEPAQEIAKEATTRGIPTYPNFFDETLVSEILSRDGKIDLVTINNTFANIDNVKELLQSIHEILAEDGTLVIETLYAPDLVTNKLFDVVYHEHLGYYSLADLEELLRQHDLHVFDVQRSLSKGGSFRVYATKARKTPAPSDELHQLRTFEKLQKIGSINFWAKFHEDINMSQKEANGLLSRLLDQGKVIVGYGASVGATPIIYSYGLQQFFTFLVDDNFIKQNTFSPGYHIPVYGPERILSSKVDYLFLIAWRYAENIISNNFKYVELGGKFIVPVPEIRVF